MKGRTLCFIASLFAAQTLQAQGILLVQQSTNNGIVSTARIQIDKTKMRIETGDNAILFDSRSQTQQVIYLTRKTYMQVTRQQIEQLRQTMRAAGVPDTPAAAVRVDYRRTGTDKVGQWTCTKYEGYRGPEKVIEVCAAEPQTLLLTALDFDVAKQMGELMRLQAVPQIADRSVIFATQEVQGFAGVVLRRTIYMNGNVASVEEIKELRRETFPAATFEIPPGFKPEVLSGR